MKLRAFAELLTGAIYEKFRLPRPVETEFAKLLTAQVFKTAVPCQSKTRYTECAKEGIQAAHGGTVTPQRATELLEDAYPYYALEEAIAICAWPIRIPRSPTVEPVISTKGVTITETAVAVNAAPVATKTNTGTADSGGKSTTATGSYSDDEMERADSFFDDVISMVRDAGHPASEQAQTIRALRDNQRKIRRKSDNR